MTSRPPFRSWVEDYPHPDRREMPPVDREAFRIRAVQRANTQRARTGTAKPKTDGRGRTTRAKFEQLIGHRDMAAAEAARFRTTDPIEAARLHLQRRGYAVVRASMFGGRPDQWDIAGRDRWISNDELLALAQRQGFTMEGRADASAD